MQIIQFNSEFANSTYAFRRNRIPLKTPDIILIIQCSLLSPQFAQFNSSNNSVFVHIGLPKFSLLSTSVILFEFGVIVGHKQYVQLRCKHALLLHQF